MVLKDIIGKAYKDRYAIGAFNVYNLESARAVYEAAKAKDKPVILQLSEKAIEYAGFEMILGIVGELKRQSKDLIFLHLDHGSSLDLIKKCVKGGFDSVMFDGSGLPLDQNIAISRDLRQMAHRNGVVFEAEIGKIGGVEDRVTSGSFKTNPSEALRFAEEVKPDMLAVAIGNIHGKLTAAEELDFTLLAKISDLVKIPLVLHGCSNRASREYQVAISEGVVKINIDTELREAFVQGLKTALHKKLVDPREILSFASGEISKCVKEKIEIFSCSKLKC